MKKRVLQIVALILGLVVLVGIAYLIKTAMQNHVSTRYDVEVEITEEQRASYEQRLADAKSRIEKQEGEGNEWWMAYLEAAHVASSLGRNGEAEEYYQTFLKRFPEHRIALVNYAHLYSETGRYVDAEAIYGKLVNTTFIEEDLRDYVESIKAQNESGKRNDDLLSVLEAAIPNYGQTPYLMQELGDFYEKLGNCDLAAQHYEILLTLLDDESQKAQVERDIARVRATCK